MTFRELNVKGVYGGTGSSDALTDFLLPALRNAKTYDRVAGYFSSAVFAQTAPGITEFVRKRGSIRLITSHVLARRDAEAMQSGDDSVDSLAREFAETIAYEGASLERQIAAQYVKAMCWLLKEGLLEIQFVVPDSNAELHPDKFHSKFGILTDEQENSLYFSGSTNETWLAWGKNIENLSIYKSWEPAFKEHCDAYRQTFEDLWIGENIPGWSSVPLPDAIKKRLVSLAPEGEFPEIENLESKLCEVKVERTKIPRDYQIEAVNAWRENRYKGILEMATGTGKTMTARLCMEAAREEGSLLVVVVAPYQHISDQWIRELSQYDTMQVGSSGSWKGELQQLQFESQLGLYETKILVVVKNTAATAEFSDYVDDISTYFDNLMIVGDEVHWLGAKSFQRALNPSAQFRLGLSATPERYHDEEGTEVLRDYFGGGSVFKFDLEKALNWKNPETGEIGVLCPYEYHPIFVELTDEEVSEYAKLTKRISTLRGKKDKSQEDYQVLERLWILRADISKSAANKVPEFAKLVDNLGANLSRALVYCADFSQMRKVQAVARERGVDTAARVTGLEGTNKSEYFKGVSEREHILRSFERGKHDVLFAIDCLDEGVDIPSAHLGIILASSGNSKEFIQRRGRLMRKSPGKSVSRIYDFVVLPPDVGGETLRLTELRRVDEFGSLAINAAEVQSVMLESEMGGCTRGK